MTATVHGLAITQGGLFHQTDHAGRTAGWCLEAHQLRSRQRRCPITLEHDRQIGTVAAIERDGHGNLWIVGELDTFPPALARGDRFYSLSFNARPNGVDREDAAIDAVGIVEQPAAMGLAPIRMLDGALHSRSRWVMDATVRGRIDRAYENTVRSHDDWLTITDPLPRIERANGINWVDGQPVGAAMHIRPSRIISIR